MYSETGTSSVQACARDDDLLAVKPGMIWLLEVKLVPVELPAMIVPSVELARALPGPPEPPQKATAPGFARSAPGFQGKDGTARGEEH
jgi:hypothetical protein